MQCGPELSPRTRPTRKTYPWGDGMDEAFRQVVAMLFHGDPKAGIASLMEPPGTVSLRTTPPTCSKESERVLRMLHIDSIIGDQDAGLQRILSSSLPKLLVTVGRARKQKDSGRTASPAALKRVNMARPSEVKPAVHGSHAVPRPTSATSTANTHDGQQKNRPQPASESMSVHQTGDAPLLLMSPQAPSMRQSPRSLRAPVTPAPPPAPRTASTESRSSPRRSSLHSAKHMAVHTAYASSHTPLSTTGRPPADSLERSLAAPTKESFKAGVLQAAVMLGEQSTVKALPMHTSPTSCGPAPACSACTAGGGCMLGAWSLRASV